MPSATGARPSHPTRLCKPWVIWSDRELIQSSLKTFAEAAELVIPISVPSGQKRTNLESVRGSPCGSRWWRAALGRDLLKEFAISLAQAIAGVVGRWLGMLLLVLMHAQGTAHVFPFHRITEESACNYKVLRASMSKGCLSHALTMATFLGDFYSAYSETYSACEAGRTPTASDLTN